MARKLVEILQKHGINNVVHLGGFETTGISSPLIEAIRKMIEKNRFMREPWFKETALLLAEFLERVYDDVLPALNKGKVIIFECYYESLIVYQAARLAEEKRFRNWKDEHLLEYVRSIVDPFCLDVPPPDIIFYLKISNDEEIKRRLARRNNREYSEEDDELQKRIESIYELLLKHKAHVVEIDTAKTKLNEEEKIVKNTLIQKGVINCEKN